MITAIAAFSMSAIALTLFRFSVFVAWNNGLADAANIGWKLGWVLSGKAGNGLLDSYTPERRGATLDVFANATKSARFMTPHTHGWKLHRDAALSLALTHPFAGELANPRQTRSAKHAANCSSQNSFCC